MRFIPIIFVSTAMWMITSSATASPLHEHSVESDHQHDAHEHNHSVRLSPDLAHRSGITTQAASSGVLQQTALLFGRVKPDPHHISHIRARFPGLVRQVNVRIGDEVKAGAIIARVEANDSLRVYDIASPIDGTVIERHANIGEYTGDATLFTLANHAHLELDLRVFFRDAQHIRPGQKVEIYHPDSATNTAIAHGTIAYLTAGDGDTSALTAHVPLAHATSPLLPGALVEALVTIAQDEIALLADKRAVQTMKGQSVIFVQQGNNYSARGVTLGRSNTQFVEVLSGLHTGEQYVVNNSFLLKADLEKSGAAHAH